MNNFGIRPGIILLREGTDSSQVSFHVSYYGSTTGSTSYQWKMRSCVYFSVYHVNLVFDLILRAICSRFNVQHEVASLPVATCDLRDLQL